MADRFHLVSRDGRAALVRGVPDPERPNDAKRDGKDGPAIITGDPLDTAFWGTLQAAGYRWVERGFARFWIRNATLSVAPPADQH